MDRNTVSLKLCMASQATTIESLLKENDDKELSIKSLEKQLADFQNRQIQLENLKIELESVQKRLENENQLMAAKNQDAQQEIQSLTQQTSQLEKEVHSLNSAIVTIQDERDDLKQQINEVQGDLQELDDYKTTNQELSSENQNLQRKLSSIQYTLDNTQRENEDLGKQNESLQIQLSSVKNNNSLLQQKITGLENTILTSANQIESLQSQVKNKDAELNQREALMDQYQRESNQNAQAVIDLQSLDRQHKTDYDLLQQQYELLGDQMHQKESEVRQLQEDGQSLQTLFNQKVMEISTLQQANTDLSKQLQTVTQKASYLYRSIQLVTGPSRRSTPIKTRGNDSLAEITSEEGPSADEAVKTLQEWSQGLMNDNRSLRDTMDRMEFELSELRSRVKEGVSIDGLNKELNDTRLNLKLKCEEVDRLSRELSNTQSDLSSKNQLIQSLTTSSNAAERLNQQLRESHNAIEDLKAKFSSTANEYNQLVDKYNVLSHQSQQQEEALKQQQVKENQQLTLIEDLRKQIEQERNHINQLTQEATTYQQAQFTSSQYEEKLNVLSQQLQEASAESAQLQAMNNDLQQQMNDISAEVSSLQQQVIALSQEKEQLVQQYNGLSLQKQQDTSLLQNKLQSMTQVNRQAQKELDELRLELSKKKMEITRLQSVSVDKEKGDSLINQLQSELNQRENELRQMEETINQLTLQNNNINTSSAVTYERLQTLLKSIHDVVQASRGTNSSLHVSVYNDSLAEITSEEGPSVDEAVKTLQEWSQGLMNDNRSLRDTMDRMEFELSELRSRVKEGVSIDGLNKELNDTRLNLKLKCEEVDRLSRELSNTQSDLSSKNRDLIQLQKSLNQQLDENHIQSAQLETLQKELESTKQLVDEYSKRLLDVKIKQGSSSQPSQLASQLQELQDQLNSARSTISTKELRIATLESELTTTKTRLEEAINTLQLLEASLDQLKATRTSSEEMAKMQQEVANLKVEKIALEEQKNQYMTLYSSLTQQVTAKSAEIAQLKQTVQLKEQEVARLIALKPAMPQNTLDTTLKQYLDTIQLKDRQIIQLEGEKQSLSVALDQAKKEAELAATRATQAEINRLQFNGTQESAVVLDLRSQLLAKQQEIASLQQQLQAEINLVKSMKSSYLELDQLLSERANNQSSSVQVLLKAKEDHNAYLQKMVASLEAELREQKSHTTPIGSAGMPLLQPIINQISPMFPDASITSTSLLSYITQLCQMVQEEKQLYSNLRQQFDKLSSEKNDLAQKVMILQGYANGHNAIDKKADSFIQDLIRQRNDFEQQYKTAVFENEKKTTEINQLRRSLKQEKETNIKMLKRKNVEADYSPLIEECMNICQLAKIDKNRKLESISDIVDTLKLVRRGIASMLNLFKRENERLNFENKRLKEISDTNKANEERITKKIKDIIKVVQSQGVALKEFVVAFQSIKK